MLVSQHTKIAALLQQHPKALEAIVGLNPKFEKLRNPYLRKLMAGRVSIGMAAKIGGCSPEDFFRALRPLGFNTAPGKAEKVAEPLPLPAFLQQLDPRKLVVLDVRPVLAAGQDPLKQILAAVKALKPDEVLKIINTFEPTPLLELLKKKGFHAYVQSPAPGLVETLFYRDTAPAAAPLTESNASSTGDWEQIETRFASQWIVLDVRALEMPKPMMAILEALDGLPAGKALFVYHKRIPVFLLPELSQRGFQYRSRQISDSEVHLLMFRD